MLFQGREDTNISAGCVPVVYRGSFCRNILESYQNRFFWNESVNGQIFIASVVDQEAAEQLAINLSNASQNFTSECQDQARELICSYLFGLCTGNGTLHLPTAEQCMATNDFCVSDLENSDSDAIDCSSKGKITTCRHVLLSLKMLCLNFT